MENKNMIKWVSLNESHFALTQVEKLPLFSFDPHHKDETMSESNWQQSLVIKGACKSHMLANQRYNTAMMYVKGIFGKLQVVLDNLTFDVQQLSHHWQKFKATFATQEKNKCEGTCNL